MLAAAVGRDGGAECGPFCGNGFRDTTRVADGSPELWRDIVRTNAAALLTEMEAFTERWEAFANALRREDYEEIGRLLERGRCGRRALLGESAPSSPRMDSA
jgi:prephenate dehydrogenase